MTKQTQQYLYNDQGLLIGTLPFYDEDDHPTKNATLKQPPKTDDPHMVCVFKDNKWNLMHDYRNTYIYNTTTKKFQYGEIWESIPSHIITDQPICSMDENNIYRPEYITGYTPLWQRPPTKPLESNQVWQWQETKKTFIKVYDLSKCNLWNKATAQKETLTGYKQDLNNDYTLQDPSILKDDQPYAKFDHQANKWGVDTIKKDQTLKDNFLRRRNDLLNKSDKILVADYPIKGSDLEQVKAWRTHLRDVTKTKNFHKKPMPPIPQFLIPKHIKL